MLFNHAERSSETLVVSEGLRPPISVGLALDLHNRILPQMGQSVLNLTLGSSCRNRGLNGFPQFATGAGSFAQGIDDDRVQFGIRFGIRLLASFALVDFLMEFFHNGVSRFITRVNQSGVNGGQSGFLHDDSLSGL